MEIEAKYITADADAIAQLAQADSLGDYQLYPAPSQRIVDRYYDTPDRRLWRAGYALRTRRQNDRNLVTLKGRGGAEGAVHHREEIEFDAPPGSKPEDWPHERARDLVLSLTEGQPLAGLLTIRQKRDPRYVGKGEQLVAMLSLDEVEMEVGDTLIEGFTVEVELVKEGTTEDLRVLEEFLLPYGLQPESRSKFEIALSLLDEIPAASESDSPPADPSRPAPLPTSSQEAVPTADPPENTADTRLSTPVSRSPIPDSSAPPVTVQSLCTRHAVDMDHARQVAALALALFDSLPEVHGLPLTRRPLLESAALLHNVGLNVNPEKHHTVGRDLILNETLDGYGPPERDMLACLTRFHRKKVRPEEEPVFTALPEDLRRETLALAALLRVGDALDYSQTQSCRILSAGAGADAAYLIIDGPHAEVETERAEKKADLWNDLFTLPLRVRNAAPVGGAVSDETEELPEEAPFPPAASPEALVLIEPEGVTVIGLEGERPEEDGEGVPESLPVNGAEAVKDVVLAYDPLTGEEVLLVIPEIEAVGEPAEENEGRAPDFSETSKLPDIESPAAPSEVKEEGGESASASGAEETPKSDSEADPPDRKKKPGPGVTGDDPIAEAGRKVLRFHFEQLLANEAGTIEGEDIEALHDMRVATRRLRAAAKLFGPFLPEKEVRRLENGLRRTGRALGPVRDLDVMLDKAEKDAEEHENLSREGLEPILRAWEKERKSARKEMAAYLCGGDYAEFKRDFERFLGLPHLSGRARDAAVLPGGVRVRYVAPGLIWEHYGQVRAYEPHLAGAPVDTLHALRIDCKRFRYALEFLREPLGKPADKPISVLTKAQDHLGELHDADVGAHLLRQFLEGWWRKAAKEGSASAGAQGVTQYLFLREQELREKIDTFPALWERLTNDEFRQRLADATASL